MASIQQLLGLKRARRALLEAKGCPTTRIDAEIAELEEQLPPGERPRPAPVYRDPSEPSYRREEEPDSSELSGDRRRDGGYVERRG